MERVGREQWLEEAMDRWEQSLLRVCFAYLGDIALAEDAVQETFLKAWKGYDRFRGNASEKTWLMRIAINVCKDLRRSAWLKHTDSRVSIDRLPEGSEPLQAADDEVLCAVMGLKPKLREVVLLCWYQQFSAVEAAQALRISRSAVYHRLEQARTLLQKELEAWYYED